MGGPSTSRFELAISNECQEDLRQLIENREAYFHVVENAGEVEIDESWRWGPQTRMYVGEQCSLISRNAANTKGYTGLSKVIEFTKRHPDLLAEPSVSVTMDELFLRKRINRACWSSFTAEAAAFDLETLRRLNRIVSPLSEMTGRRWDEELLTQIEAEDRVVGEKVYLPIFPSIDLAIQCFLDLFTKYAELMFGGPFQPFVACPNPRVGSQPCRPESD